MTSTFADQIATIGDAIPAATALEPGRIIWLHGIKQAKLPGAFYVKDTELNGTPAEPWKADNRFEEERGERGYSTPALKIAVLGQRTQWFIQGDRDNGTITQWIARYEEGSKKLVEFLVLVEGISEPMVLSASGMNKAKPLIDAVYDYRNGLLKQASRIAKVQLPLWAFWLPFQNRLDSNGKTAYQEAADGQGKTYGSVVTPPALRLPPDAMDALFVGKETLERGAAIVAEYHNWPKTKRLSNDMVEGQVITVKALPEPRRNVPQALPDDEGVTPF